MHLAAGIWKDGKDMRLDNSIKIEIKSLNDKILTKSLRFEKNWKKTKFLKIGSVSKKGIYMLEDQSLRDIGLELFIS